MNNKKNSIILKTGVISLVVLLGLVFFAKVNAEQSSQPASVNYKDQPVVDSDLDGLTDQGELQIYHTDFNKVDSDSDGYGDGAEVIAGSDPLDASSVPGSLAKQKAQNIANAVQVQTPWPWYISRASGLVGFSLLYISIFLGLTIRIPFMRNLFSPLYALNAHGWIALQATIFALLHGSILMLDKFIDLNFVGVFVPFSSSYQPILVGLGTIGFYLMVILTATSYFRSHLSYKLWRTLHYFNIVLYFGVIVHAYFLGTDMKNEIVRDIFVGANIMLILFMLVNMFVRIKKNIINGQAIDIVK